MPAWWGRKSSKNKEQQQLPQPESHAGIHFNFIKSPIRNGRDNSNSNKAKSFDEVSSGISTGILSRTSPRTSRDLTPLIGGSSSSGFSCFDSDGAEKIGHPLPRPSISSPHSLVNDQADGDALGSASISGSSVSSSGSYDHHPIEKFDGVRFVFLEKV